MIDLSSPELQATFKRLRRASLFTSLIMAAFTIGCAALAIWAAVTIPKSKGMTWAETLFLVLLCVIVACMLAIFVLEYVMHRPYMRTIYKYVAEGYESADGILEGEYSTLSMMLAGDKLTVIREENGKVAQFDLSPVKSYTGVCSSIVSAAKRYIYDYYFVHGAKSVIIKDSVRGREKTKTVVGAGKQLKDRKNSFFVRSGIIK